MKKYKKSKSKFIGFESFIYLFIYFASVGIESLNLKA